LISYSQISKTARFFRSTPRACTLLVVPFCLLVAGCGTRELPAEPELEDRPAELFQRNCASCHIGAPKFAPPLSGAVVEGREVEVRKIILEGGFNMPAFKHMLSAAEADMIVAYLKTQKEPPKSVNRDQVYP